VFQEFIRSRRFENHVAANGARYRRGTID
jgi:hypothetical protein